MWTLGFLGKLSGLPPLLLRALLGYAFFASHGFAKLNPGGHWGTFDSWDWGAAFVDKVSHPAFLAYIAAWTEFLGGFALLAGLFTRWASLGLMGVMLYAALVHHSGEGYARMEMALSYAGCCLALACLGPGNLSLDRLFFGRDAVEP